jgi:hypothetical protein
LFWVDPPFGLTIIHTTKFKFNNPIGTSTTSNWHLTSYFLRWPFDYLSQSANCICAWELGQWNYRLCFWQLDFNGICGESVSYICYFPVHWYPSSYRLHWRDIDESNNLLHFNKRSPTQPYQNTPFFRSLFSDRNSERDS